MTSVQALRGLASAMSLPTPLADHVRTAHDAFYSEGHASPANTVEDGLRHIVARLHEASPEGRWLSLGHSTVGDLWRGDTVRVRFPLAVPTAQQITSRLDAYSLYSEGSRGVALPTGEWLSHPAVIHAPGQIDNELYLAAWVLEPDALERVESAGVTRAYAQVAWAVGIRTLDGLLEAWDGGVPTEYLLAMDGAL